MVWYSMVWYGMVWYGMIWYSMVWYGIVWYGMVWYGIVWYRMAYGMVYSDYFVFSWCRIEVNVLKLCVSTKLSVTLFQTPMALTWKPDCLFCKLVVVIVRVLQAQPRAHQPRRSRDTAAAVSPTPVERDDFTFFFTILLLSMSRRTVNPAVVGVAAVYPSPFYRSVL